MESNVSSLYELATTAVVNNFSKLRPGLDLYPEQILFDVIFHVHTQPTLLTSELSQFTTFQKLLKVAFGDRRTSLHQMLQATVASQADVPRQLAQSFYGEVERLLGKLCSATHSKLTSGNTCRTLELGFSLGDFLCEAGWYPAATTVHRGCVSIMRRMKQTEPNYVNSKLECLSKLLHSLVSYCQFTEASAIFHELSQFIWEQSLTGATYPNLAYVYNEFSLFHSQKFDIDKAYRWAMEAVKLLTPQSPAKLVVDVLRQAGESCCFKQEITKGKLLIEQAVRQARETYGVTHPKYADCQMDYGRYLSGVGRTTESEQVYKNALDLRLDIFGPENLQVAIAHKELGMLIWHDTDLSDPLSTAKLGEARRHAELSLSIMGRHLPAQHLQLAFSKSMLAVILDQTAVESLLSETESLLLSALEIVTSSLGECNLAVPFYYRRLGRHYENMKRFEEAERMYLKSLQIAESLLGTEAYEVAKSLIFLAALYYDMDEDGKSEELFLRSIRILRKLCELSYDLEYCYNSLITVYTETGNYEQEMEYRTVLEEWKISRDAQEAQQNMVQDVEEDSRLSLQELIEYVTQ